MRQWQRWQQNLALVCRQNPPQLVESVMLLLGLILCPVWMVLQSWQYLVLCLSYIVGAIASILVREWLAPSPFTHQIRFTALFSLGLLVSVVSFYLVRTGH
jgi:multisubunit Na+/H+ antiporter MnhE subunit